MTLHEDSHYTFRFADDRIIPRFHLDGVVAGTPVAVFRIDPATEARGELLTTATAGESGWVDLPEPLRVRAGETFVAVPESDQADRRLVGHLEQAIQEATQWVVFEPNTESTWDRVRREVAAFLDGQWRADDLVGRTAAEAYFVRCDRTTMTQADLDAGRVLIVVGVALVKPAEFVIFRIGQWTADATG
jgi:hypothetical protein